MAGVPDDPLPHLDVRVPDDARDLEADRMAYLEELRRRAAASSRGGPTTGSTDLDPEEHWDPLQGGAARARRVAVRFMVGWVVMALLVGGMMLAFTPRGAPEAATLELASVPQAPGTLGGLLPDARVDIGGEPRMLRGVRPGVIAVVPQGACLGGSCEQTIRDVWRQAREYRLRLFVAGAPVQLTLLRSLTRGPAGGSPTMTDPTAALDVYRPVGLTLVLVHADGVVGSVIRDVPAGARLEQYLRPLKEAGAGLS